MLFWPASRAQAPSGRLSHVLTSMKLVRCSLGGAADHMSGRFRRVESWVQPSSRRSRPPKECLIPAGDGPNLRCQVTGTAPGSLSGSLKPMTNVKSFCHDNAGPLRDRGKAGRKGGRGELLQLINMSQPVKPWPMDQSGILARQSHASLTRKPLIS